MATADDDARRARFRALKLGALVRDHLGGDPGVSPGVFALGAGARVGEDAWVLLEDDPARGLGPALAWAVRQGATALRLLAERDTGLLARRAGAFRFPIEVWHVEGRTLLPAVAEPLAPPPGPSPEHLELVPVIEAGGATAVVEHGVVLGEVRGLEVCRVVDDAATGAVRLEVGVGVHDREAFAIIHGDLPTEAALRGVVDAVTAHRGPGAVDHPLRRLVPERLMRWQLTQDPRAIGLGTLAPVEPPQPRPNVKDRFPATAMGMTADGDEVVVVCSVGVDLDVIPYATDARVAAGGGGSDAPGVGNGSGRSTWVVVPARDRVAITSELIGLLDEPVRLVDAPVEPGSTGQAG